MSIGAIATSVRRSLLTKATAHPDAEPSKRAHAVDDLGGDGLKHEMATVSPRRHSAAQPGADTSPLNLPLPAIGPFATSALGRLRN